MQGQEVVLHVITDMHHIVKKQSIDNIFITFCASRRLSSCCSSLNTHSFPSSSPRRQQRITANFTPQRKAPQLVFASLDDLDFEGDFVTLHKFSPRSFAHRPNSVSGKVGYYSDQRKGGKDD
jgi:hypothetical protein